MKKKSTFFSKNLQRQILIPFLSLLILAGGVLAAISYGFSVKLTTDELVENVKGQTDSINDSFKLFFNTQENVLKHYVYQNEFKTGGSQMVDTMQDISASNEAIRLAVFGKANGEVTTVPAVNLDDGFDPRTRPWYIEAEEHKGESIWTKPYIDDNTGELVVSVAQAVTDGDKVLGVLSLDLEMDALLSIVKDVQIGETGYAAIFDQEGRFLSHPQQEYVGKDVSEESYYKKIKAQQSDTGIVSYQFEGLDKSLGYTVNEETGWIIMGAVNTGELKEKAKPVMVPILITLGVIVVISVIVTYFLARSIVKPIRSLQSKAKQVEEGDLTIDLTYHHTNEIGQLSETMNEMRQSLHLVITEVSDAVHRVSAQSEELNQSAYEVRQGSDQIAVTMSELADGSESQANHSTTLSERMNQFMEKIRITQQEGEAINQTSQQVLEVTNEGEQLMSESVQQMNHIHTIVQDAVEKVKGLDERSQEIAKLINVIHDIAEQTNLLSLNAAIEAARAGEHGKGFAVVADEVRKLAEQVAHSVGDITSIVQSIQADSTAVAGSLEEGYKEVHAGTNQIEGTKETFDTIQRSVSQMAERVTRISTTLQEVAKDSDAMNHSIEEVAAVSEQAAASVQQASASAQQSSSSMEEVSSSADELAKLGEELHQKINTFKV